MGDTDKTWLNPDYANMGLFGGLLLFGYFFGEAPDERSMAFTGLCVGALYYTLKSRLDKISLEQKEQSVQLGVIRENMSKLLERK